MHGLNEKEIGMYGAECERVVHVLWECSANIIVELVLR